MGAQKKKKRCREAVASVLPYGHNARVKVGEGVLCYLRLINCSHALAIIRGAATPVSSVIA